MKYLYFTLLLFTACNSFAQRTVYFKGDHQKTISPDSAVYSRTFTDPEPGTNLYGFTETFVTGEIYRAGKSTKANEVVLDGECTEYYLSGKKASYTTYADSRKVKETLYFPNGVIYLVKEYGYTLKDSSKPKEFTVAESIITCNDSTGKALVTEGNGVFVAYYQPPNPKFNKSFFGIDQLKANNNYEEGNVKSGKKDGQWKGGDRSSAFAYTETYDTGTFVLGNSTDKDGKKHTYKVAEEAAKYPGGLPGFGYYIAHNVRYPKEDRMHYVQGKVFATFVVDKDGTTTDLQILRTPSEAMGLETLRVLKESPQWKPAEQHGIPVRQQYTIPVSFTLSERH